MNAAEPTTPPESASRNDAVTIATCPVCSRRFEPGGRRRFCSDACRQAAWRRRHMPAGPTAPLPPKGRRRAMTVYECDDCGSRVLGEQRCDDCNRWMRAVGVGGACPGCGEPVAVEELVEGDQ